MATRDLEGGGSAPPPCSVRQNRQRAGFANDQSQSHDPAGSASAWGGETPPHGQSQSPAEGVHRMDNPADALAKHDPMPEGSSETRHPHLTYEDVGQPQKLPSPAALWRYLRELDNLINFHPKTVAVPPRQSVGWRGDLIKPPKE